MSRKDGYYWCTTPYVSDRKAHWWRCFEAMRLARVALEGAADPNVTRTPAAHYAAAVRYLLEAQQQRELAKRAYCDTVKRCKCGRTYDRTEWQRLRLVGTQDDGDGGLLELRNCECRSTISVELPKDQEARP